MKNKKTVFIIAIAMILLTLVIIALLLFLNKEPADNIAPSETTNVATIEPTLPISTENDTPEQTPPVIEFTDSDPKTIEELLDRYESFMEKNGINFQIDFSLESDEITHGEWDDGYSLNGINATTTTMTADCVNNITHAKSHNYIPWLDVDTREQITISDEYTSDLYVESNGINNDTIYVQHGIATFWRYSPRYNENGLIMSLTDRNVLKAIFENAEYKKLENGYAVTIDASQMAKHGVIANLYSLSDTYFWACDYNEAVQMIAGNLATYYFDSDCRLTGIEIEDANLNMAKTTREHVFKNIDANADVSILIKNMTVQFKNWGEINDELVKVPESILNNEFIQQVGVYGVAENNTTPVTNLFKTPVNPTRFVHDIPVSDDWTDMEIVIDGVLYKGPWNADSFAENYWRTDKDGLFKAKYEWFRFNVKNNKLVIDLDGYMNHPEIKFAHGITWGSSYYDVIDAFGEPDESTTDMIKCRDGRSRKTITFIYHDSATSKTMKIKTVENAVQYIELSY